MRNQRSQERVEKKLDVKYKMSSTNKQDADKETLVGKQQIKKKEDLWIKGTKHLIGKMMSKSSQD